MYLQDNYPAWLSGIVNDAGRLDVGLTLNVGQP
jgi:hypothetical protein